MKKIKLFTKQDKYRALYLKALIAYPFICEDTDDMFILDKDDFTYLLKLYNLTHNKPERALPDGTFLLQFGLIEGKGELT